MSAAWVGRAIALAAVLLIVTFGRVGSVSAQLLSPGPLSKAHSSLEGDAHCSDCHSSGKRVDSGACLKCHTDLGARINAGQGLHGLQYKGRPCEGCHVEHLGVAASMIRWPGGDPSHFDHAQEGWTLQGAHKTTPCAKCHNKPNSRGNPTYIGLSRTCTSCHKDKHDGRFGSSCTGCHDEVAWTDLRLQDFNHDLARFPLHGAHKTVQCAKCHFDPPKYTDLRFGACTDCHKDPHSGRLGPRCEDCHDDTRWKPVTFTHTNAKHPGLSLANGHADVPCRACHDQGNLTAPSKGSECVSCHRPVHKAPFGRACANCHASIQWLGLARAVGLNAHVRTDYPLTGKHVEVPCAKCHRPERPADARYRKLAFGRCTDCHQDQHRGEFAATDHGDCRPCHTTSGYRPTLFGGDAHATTKFPLIGKHLASPCSSCHTNPRPRLDLHLTKQACADCHANPHGDQFAKEMAKGGCANCHDPRGWDLPKIDHSIWPLTGAHATAQCDSCHHPTAEDRKAGHGPSYRGIPRNCTGCHDDAHLGQFRLSQPVLECDKCHSTKVFKIPNFDHAALAGWALTGAHEKTQCAECHPTASVTGANGAERPTVRWRGPQTDCKFCHASPHERRSGAHATLPRRRPSALLAALVPAPSASAAPAPPPAAPPATPTTPARAPPSASASANPSADASANAPSSAGDGFTEAVPCSACHSTTAWKTKDTTGSGEVKFDHSTTGFPLTGQHIHEPCVACHNSSRTVSRQCVSCHEDFHRGRLSQSCDTCHVPAGWRVTRPLDIHRRTRFPLTGMHVLADCTQCHLRASEQKFTDAPIECYGCHEQDYRRPGIFPVHVGTATSPALPRDCSTCHRAVAWVPANVPASLVGSIGGALSTQTAPANHELRFPIKFGSHRGAACSDCHASLSVPRAVRCIGCHAHEPVIVLQQHRQPVATDGASCMSCHPGGARR
jgi:hypothetical protein